MASQKIRDLVFPAKLVPSASRRQLWEGSLEKSLEESSVSYPPCETDDFHMVISCGPGMGKSAAALKTTQEWFDLTKGIRKAREETDKHLKVLELSMEVGMLEQRVKSLESAQGDHSVWITTLAPKPYSLLKNIPVLVEPILPDDEDEDCSYVARFVEAGVGASGDTVEETIAYLKDRLISSFEALSNMPAEKLGDLPRRRLAVLQAVIKRSSTWHAKAGTKSQSSSRSTSRRSSKPRISATKATSMMNMESSTMVD